MKFARKIGGIVKRIKALNNQGGYLKVEPSFLTMKFAGLKWPERFRIDACKMLAMITAGHQYQTSKLGVKDAQNGLVIVRLEKPLGREGFDQLVVAKEDLINSLTQLCGTYDPLQPWIEGLADVDMSALGQR